MIDCSKDSCMSLLRALSAFKFPLTTYYMLKNVPADSNYVRTFSTNLSKNQKGFYFNWASNSKVESSKYIRELRLAAANTTDHFGVYNLTISVEDFKSLVVSAKHVQYLYIYNSSLPLDCKFDFGEQLDHCEIQGFYVDYCGSQLCGNWTENKSRFEHLVEAISNCLPFRNSLKALSIAYNGISKEEAKQVCKKYGLNELSIEGV